MVSWQCTMQIAVLVINESTNRKLLEWPKYLKHC